MVEKPIPRLCYWRNTGNLVESKPLFTCTVSRYDQGHAEATRTRQQEQAEPPGIRAELPCSRGSTVFPGPVLDG